MNALMSFTVSCVGWVVSVAGVVKLYFAKSFGAPKRHHHHARHVHGGEQGRQRADEPERFAPGWARQTKSPRTPGFPKNFILRKEPGKNRYARNRQPACEHGCKRDRHVLLQPPHAAHVLLMMHAVNYRAGAEEEESLEESVRDDVKDCCCEGAEPTGQEHVTKLRDR